MSTVPTLSAPPSRSDPANFNVRADTFLSELPPWGAAINVVAGEVNTNANTAITQAGIASTQAGIASTQAGIATTQAGLAATSASAALVSEEALKGAWLTAKTGDPSVDDNGDALVAGVSYLNTTLDRVRIYNGTAWQDAVGAISGDFTILREVKIATAGQTVFNLTNTYNTGTNSLMLYLNGSRLLNSDYTETNSSTVTLAQAAALGDELLVEIGVVSAGTTAVAGLTSFNPTAGISATNVQSAIAELETDVQQDIADAIAAIPPSLPFNNNTALAQTQAIALSF
jgi:hypothetical protein